MIKKNYPLIGIIDTGTSNIKSVLYAVEKAKGKPKVITSLSENTIVDGLIVPGIGSFGYVMDELKKKKLNQVINEKLDKNIPNMFICVGMQILFSESEEMGVFKGLGYFKGCVRKIPKETSGVNLRKIPNIGWNNIRLENQCKILTEESNKKSFYFTHSYYVQPENKKIISSTSNYFNFEFCSSVTNKNVFAFQFHPEKSGKDGIKIYQNFINLI